MSSPEMKRIKEKDMVMNVYNNGTWGTYRHLPLQPTGMLSQILTQIAEEPNWGTY